MYVGKLKHSIGAKFEYTCWNPDGEAEETETINIRIKPVSFEDGMGKNFQEAMEKITEEPAKFAQLAAGMIESWDVYEDEAGTVPYPITGDNIGKAPMSFVLSLAECIQQRLGGNPTKPENSADTSAPEERSMTETSMPNSSNDTSLVSPVDSGA